MSKVQSSILDSFISSLIKKKVADKNGDGQISNAEKALFTFCKDASDLSDKLYNSETGAAVNWAEASSKLKALTDDLATKQEAASIMYQIDSLGDGEDQNDGDVTYEEIIAASKQKTNTTLANQAKALMDMYGIKENTSEPTSVFNFDKMMNFVDMIDTDNDGDISSSNESSEVTNFGSLVSSTRVNIGGTETDTSNIVTVLNKYTNGTALTDLEQALLDAVKSGDYEAVEEKDDWTADSNKRIDLTTVTDTSSVGILRNALASGGDIEIYNMDFVSGEGKNVNSDIAGRLLIRITDSDGKVTEYRFEDVDIKNISSATETELTTIISKATMGAGDKKDVGSIANVKAKLFSGPEASSTTFTSCKYADDGKLMSFEASDGNSYQIIYTDGAISGYVKSTPADATAGTEAKTEIYSLDNLGRETEVKTYDKDGKLVSEKTKIYKDSDTTATATITNNRVASDESYPCVKDGYVIFSSSGKPKIKASGDVTLYANGVVKMADGLYDKNGTIITGTNVEAIQDSMTSILELAEGVTFDIADCTSLETSGSKISEFVKDGVTYKVTYAKDGVSFTVQSEKDEEGKKTTTIYGKDDSSTTWSAVATVEDSSELPDHSPQISGTSITFYDDDKKEYGSAVTIPPGGRAEIDADGNVTVFEKDSDTGTTYKKDGTKEEAE